MLVKEFLVQAYDIDSRIRLDTMKIKQMRQSLYGRGINYCDNKSKSSSGGNAVEASILKVIEYEERINKRINKLISVRFEIEAVIMAVENNTYKELLERRYLLYQKWERIAEEMNYDLRSVYKIHSKALKSVNLTDLVSGFEAA